MRKLATGELCAGESHAQFGGRGGRESFPTPIRVAARRYCLPDVRLRAKGETKRASERGVQPFVGVLRSRIELAMMWRSGTYAGRPGH